MIPALLLLLAAGSFEDSFRAGLLALQSGDLPAAQSSLETAARLQPSNGRVWVALAQVYSREQRASEANAAALKAQSFAAKDPGVTQILGVYYQELLREQKFREVVALVQKVDDAQSRLALGVAYYALRRFDDAAGAFLRVIELSPEVEQPYLFLGRFLDQAPNRLPAISRAFERFAQANPSHYAGYFLLAKVQPENAEKLLRRSLELNDSNAAAHFDLGAALDRDKKFEDAAAEFEKAAKLDPADAATHYRLARVYDRLGKADAAREEREAHARLVRAAGAAR